ncbi:NAD(P)H-binding protein [Mucilaginibacter sp. P25]|uniref:NAD(P)H-binding n=1 Tax=Mucilaginibacter gossypii TaxID=551996 RepID=A0A1G7U8Q1_9SPHI|nr:NAD(P)H-binding protein [Mucilaginibacter gossypii]SDG43758.1 NAD(P)H-binding [Mucilaginibacter gossypii]
MKNVIIFGASGSLASYVIDAIEELDDVELTLFVRNKNRLQQGARNKHRVIEADATNFTLVKDAIAGQHIVYVNLAGDLELMTQNIVKAMIETGVNRIIAVSSIGIYNVPLSSMLVPYRKLADIIEVSTLDYTILRPDWFTNGSEIDFTITQKGEPESGGAISRKSIAAFVAHLIGNPNEYNKENVGISTPDCRE